MRTLDAKTAMAEEMLLTRKYTDAEIRERTGCSYQALRRIKVKYGIVDAVNKGRKKHMGESLLDEPVGGKLSVNKEPKAERKIIRCNYNGRYRNMAVVDVTDFFL